MNLKRNTNKSIFVSTSSMSDVAFLLLIFIMLISLINYRKEINIEYAEANTTQKTTAEKNMEIWVDRNGNFYLDGVQAHLNDIEQAIISLQINAPDTQVHIIADRSTSYEKINVVLEILQILQYRVVSFVVKDV